jgi:hypothetical protein
MTTKSAILFVAPAFALGLLSATPFADGADSPSGPTPFDTDNQAYWSTPGDGRLVMLLRNAASFEQPVPLRVRVCVTNFTGVNNAVNLYIWTTAGFQPGLSPPPQPQTRQLSLGGCVEIDRPAAIIVQDSTITGTSTGYYQLLEQTAPPPQFTASGPSATSGGLPPERPERHEHDIELSKPHSVPAKCNLLSSLSPPPPQPSANYYAYCTIPLPKPIDPKDHINGVRLCTGVEYITSTDGKKQYAPGYLELIVDQKFLTAPKDSDYDKNFSPITPQGCRDFFGATAAYFMVGPNVAGGFWDPAKIQSVNVTLQEIRWAPEIQ